MKRVKLTVAYDGTNYCGWQVQPNGLAVQEVLNRCLSEFLGTETEVIGASHRCRCACAGQCRSF